jgi:hypothetical protein
VFTRISFYQSQGSDGHDSTYNLEKLSEYVFENELKASMIEYWKKDTLTNKFGGIQKIDFHKYVADDDKLRRLLEALIKFGVVIIDNVNKQLSFCSIFYCLRLFYCL